MLLKIGIRLTQEVADINEAVEVYERVRDASYEGASTFEYGSVFNGNTQIATISYNGRVWPVE